LAPKHCFKTGISHMKRPIVWSIAGSDSGGGAGIQADLKTMNALGVHGCSVITSLTAQNSTGVFGVEYPSLHLLQAQLDALRSDLPPMAIKLGMLGQPDSIPIIVQTLQAFQSQKPYVVCDPVMVSSSGHSLLETNSTASLIQDLLPHVDLLTPNLPEAEVLLQRKINTVEAIEKAAHDLLAFGVQSVLIKGGHDTQSFSQDYWTNGQNSAWLTSPRQISRHTHGTGCTLSAAIAACYALGFEELDSIVIAKAYVNQGIRNAPELGAGHGSLAHLGWPEFHEDLPWVTAMAETGQSRLHFQNCGETPLGFYPIVDRFEWLKILLPLGVTSLQLRIKDLTGTALEQEIAMAVDYAQSFNCRLFINDYWELALQYGAYGVHLGQEDLQSADLAAIKNAGLCLGISTHNYAEVARALWVIPSYIAIGPIFPTTTKLMRYRPQGLEALHRWRRTLPYPLVAIAGIFLDNAPQVLATGVDGLAVVRDITNTSPTEIEERVKHWLALFNPQPTSMPYQLAIK
jgi:hydroxymethylpyrimidine kinase / phosphomethylpyrimidine kinase / thiamine-phosphate diphosphorylase